MVKKGNKVKKEKVITPFWPEMIAIHFDFCRKNFGSEPVFDNSAPRDLKYIVLALKKRAESGGVEWTLKVASERLGNFFMAAYNHKDPSSGIYWLREHWTLFNLNRQKEIIFFNKKSKQNAGKEEDRTTGEKNSTTPASRQGVKPSGSFGQL